MQGALMTSFELVEILDLFYYIYLNIIQYFICWNDSLWQKQHFITMNKSLITLHLIAWKQHYIKIALEKIMAK